MTQIGVNLKIVHGVQIKYFTQNESILKEKDVKLDFLGMI